MKKKLTALLVLLALAASGCASQGVSQDTDATGTSTSVETTSVAETELKPDLPEVDYDGYEFKPAYRDDDLYNWHLDIGVLEESSGDVINDAKYERNLAVEELLNCKITATVMKDDRFGNSAIKSIMANDSAYDLIAPHAHNSWSAYIAEGYALNWNMLTYCNFDMPWWDKDSRTALSVADEMYTIAGDFSYYSFGYTNALVFNKRILNSLGEDAPYQSVSDGKWTFDEFKRLSLLSVLDLNGDSQFKMADDQFGYTTNWWRGPVTFFFAGGARTTEKDADDIPYITLGDERSTKVLENYFELMDNDGMYLHLSDKTDSFEAFREGHVLFNSTTLIDMEKLRDVEDDWGVLPHPKYDEAQETYYSNVDAGVHMYIVPADTIDVERTSVILEALCYEGYKRVIPAFYEVALQNKYVRDEESLEMLDIIKNTRVFDFGYFTNYDHEIGCAPYYLSNLNNKGLSSYVAKIKDKATTKLETFVNTIIENKTSK